MKSFKTFIYIDDKQFISFKSFCLAIDPPNRKMLNIIYALNLNVNKTLLIIRRFNISKKK